MHINISIIKIYIYETIKKKVKNKRVVRYSTVYWNKTTKKTLTLFSDYKFICS